MTVRSLGYNYIGVGAGDKATKLQNEGATYLALDFSDIQSLLGILAMLREQQRDSDFPVFPVSDNAQPITIEHLKGLEDDG